MKTALKNAYAVVMMQYIKQCWVINAPSSFAAFMF